MKRNKIFLLLAACLGGVLSGFGSSPAADHGYILAEERTYRPDDLHEYINGQAEQYLRYGFVGLRSMRWTGGGSPLTVDVYEFTSVLDAYGLYLAGGTGLGDGLNLGMPSAGDPYGAAAVRGRHLLKLAVEAPGSELSVAARLLLEQVATSLPDEPRPPELDYLPPEAQDPTTLAYVRDGLWRLPELPRGLSARYRLADGKRIDLGVALFEGPAAAEAALTALAARLSESPGRNLPMPDLPPGWRLLNQNQRGWLVLAPKGRFLVLAARLQDAASAVPLMQAALARLP